jgi:hypothetical protein
MSYRGGEGHFLPGGDLHVVKVKGDRLLGPWQEWPPCRHVGIQSSRQEWRGYIEHQNLGVVIRANPLQVFFANCFRPSVDERSDILFIRLQGLLLISDVSLLSPLGYLTRATPYTGF